MTGEEVLAEGASVAAEIAVEAAVTTLAAVEVAVPAEFEAKHVVAVAVVAAVARATALVDSGAVSKARVVDEASVVLLAAPRSVGAYPEQQRLYHSKD